jgi:Ca2+:H+ antiporter
MRFSEQGFDASEYYNISTILTLLLINMAAATQIHSSLLSLSVGAVLLPAAYHFALGDADQVPSDVQKQNILHMSHGVWSFISLKIKTYAFHSL